MEGIKHNSPVSLEKNNPKSHNKVDHFPIREHPDPDYNF